MIEDCLEVVEIRESRLAVAIEVSGFNKSSGRFALSGNNSNPLEG